MADLLLYETGNGGDLQLSGNDMAVVEGYENLPYLSMFGGENWWGNSFLQGDASTLFSSTTERVMQEVAMNSAGRIKIEAAIMADLAHISKSVPETKITVNTYLLSDDRLEIRINIDGATFYFMWNPAQGFLNYKV